ncbi:hypothetical protein [Streptomyces muensis]|uniref:Uncharacterized protein n=1 Tax=Streptomyces muensis TaxID=1077944 RepID=A0A9X1PW92_STRM4|nr:hypothetical protein [Streptomyces muensis]MCF1592908.1 hypothetical protein [Streptomyces muensis]
MTSISEHVNGAAPEFFGELTTARRARHLSDLTPVLATPAAFAAGVAVSLGAYAVGYAMGAGGNNKER